MDIAKLIVDCKNTHGEGIVWCEKRKQVLWTDIEGRFLWMYCPETQVSTSLEMPDRLCAFMIREDNTLLAGFDSYVAIMAIETNTVVKQFDFEPNNPFSRLNDGKSDGNGNFVVGGENESGDCSYNTSVIKIDRDLKVHTLIEDVTCANSICFSPDGSTMYYTDTPTSTIFAYDYSPDCVSLPTPKVLFKGEGRFSLPDGSTVDKEGYIWNAVWGSNAVIRIHPETGSIVRIIDVPAKNPTCVVIGGTNLKTLFITSSRKGLTDEELNEQPSSGGLYSIDL
ncbi:SMP-30/gluconolactonase/LRE family protein [Vibrio algarum]|uniref:SMP-30/gluconolactonase/LRE family protein n=1 Tax=Vibrio algarum TaxID=3020714 RepID=A0ABT4YR75_9VIBR|nr:SMP-30/gluconolactonase/LRE family protein [Vibrio sp. KJ40-1]MDB1124054.1 SMP-30/gluconolactonase/LRE family protein [Vibrio sp. KJ40-1]